MWERAPMGGGGGVLGLGETDRFSAVKKKKKKVLKKQIRTY